MLNFKIIFFNIKRFESSCLGQSIETDLMNVLEKLSLEVFTNFTKIDSFRTLKFAIKFLYLIFYKLTLLYLRGGQSVTLLVYSYGP